MKLYHGTSERAAECIEEEGFFGSELDHLTVGRHVENGVVFCSASIEEAQGYGNVVFEINLEGAPVHEFFDGNSRHYFVFVEDLKTLSWWQRLETEDK